MAIDLRIRSARTQQARGTIAHPNARAKISYPERPNIRDIGPPQDATNLIIRITRPNINICINSKNGPLIQPKPPTKITAPTP